MHQGRVKWFNDAAGFGLITSTEQCDVVVARESVQTGSGTLAPGQEVEFEIILGPHGREAWKVHDLAKLS